MSEFYGIPQQLKHKLKQRRQHASISGKRQHVPAEGLSRDMDIDLSLELLPEIEIPVVGGKQARPRVRLGPSPTPGSHAGGPQR